MTDPIPVAEQISRLRERGQLIRAQLELKRLQRLQRVTEGIADWTWVGQYQALFDRARDDWQVGGPGLRTTLHDRRYGRNWPLFRTEQDLSLLRMPARVLLATNNYAAGLVEGLTSYVIGKGYTYRTVPRKSAEGQADQATLTALCDACDQAMADFQQDNEWYGGEQPGLEEELFQRSVEDGEFITCQWDEDGDTVIRTVEPEQLTQPSGTTFEEWGFGIHTPADDVQNVLGYWITWEGDNTAGEEYSPDQVTHFRRNVKRSIKRGLSDFTWDTYDALQQASRLRGAMSEGAAIQASIVGVRQHDNATPDEITEMTALLADYTRTNPNNGRTEYHTEYKPGTWLDINKGQQFLPPPIAQNLQALIPVLQACLRGAGVRWNAPEWLVSGDASNNNYASSLTAESPFTRTVIRRQTGYKTCFVRIHEVAIKNRCDAGRLVAGGRSYSWQEVQELVEVQCEAPSPETRDKLQEAQTRQIESTAGVLSPQQWCQMEGRDYDQTVTEIEEHQERTGGQGLPLPVPSGDEQ